MTVDHDVQSWERERFFVTYGRAKKKRKVCLHLQEVKASKFQIIGFDVQFVLSWSEKHLFLFYYSASSRFTKYTKYV